MTNGKKISDFFPLPLTHFSGGQNITGGGNKSEGLANILNTLQEGVPEAIGTPGLAQLIFTGIGVAGDYIQLGLGSTDGFDIQRYEFNTAPGLVTPGNIYVPITVDAPNQAQTFRDAGKAHTASHVTAEPNSLGPILPGINDDTVCLLLKESGVRSCTISVNGLWTSPVTYPPAVQGGVPAGQVYVFPMTVDPSSPALTWFLGGLNRAMLLGQIDVTGLDLTNAAGSYCITAVENSLLQTPKAIPNTAIVLQTGAVSGDGRDVLNVWALNQDPGPYPSGDIDADDVLNLLGVLVLADQ